MARELLVPTEAEKLGANRNYRSNSIRVAESSSSHLANEWRRQRRESHPARGSCKQGKKHYWLHEGLIAGFD